MPAPLLGKCPGCQRTLRLPEEAAGKTVRCRHCGTVSEARPTPKPQARRAPAPVPTPAPAPVPAAAPRTPFAFAAVPSTPPANAWAAIAEASPAEPVIRPPRRYRRGGGWLTTVFALFFLAACLGGTAAAVYYLAPKIKQKMDQQPAAGPGTQPQRVGDPDRPVGAGGPAFPRRLLGISVNNYIYANPISYGYDPRGFVMRDFGKTLDKLANKLRVPEDQVFELSDAARGRKPNPPLKPIIERTLTRFVETSRPQDRVVVVLCAHTVEVGGAPYVVPLEGELDDAQTLIPLKWVMDQLGKCPAQQKVLIADFNRYDRGRGKERPHGGKLAPATEAMLKNPPAGLQVWSACSAGEFSHESDDDYEFTPDGGRPQAMKGGAFLCMFSVAFLQGVGGKIQRPEDPLPVETLAAKVNPYTVKFSRELDDPDAEADEPAKGKDDKKPAKAAAGGRRALQNPFLAGGMMDDAVAYDPGQPPAEPVAIPTPQEVYGKGLVAREQVRKMLDVFDLPPVKEARKSDSAVRLDAVLPFRAEALAAYRNDTPPGEVSKNADKYPLRAAVVDAVEKLRRLESGDIPLPTTLLEAQVTDAAKADIRKMQRGPAGVQLQLDMISESLQKVAAQRKEEKSMFWQATFDYVEAQVKARYVYVHEYNSVAGQVRKDALPELDRKKGQVGWRLASKESLTTTDGEVKEMAKEARKLYTKLAKEHPGTPWAVLAKREKETTLGLRWEPFAEAKDRQAEAPPDKK